MAERYTFDGLPLEPIRAGTTVLLAGPIHAGTHELALRMVDGADGEGSIYITTNRRAGRLIEDCERAGVDVSADRTAILDCVGGDEPGDLPARIHTVSGPSDLTGIGMRFSEAYRDFRGEGVNRVRTGIVTISTLLSFADLQTVSRFVHTFVGRLDSVDGLGVVLIDPSTHDERTVSTLSQFCSGRIEVREGDDAPELRARGLADQPREWQQFDPAGSG